MDPFERWNRKVFAFNETIDEAVLKPVARAYRDVVPELVRTGVSNVFGNIADVWSRVNHLLQGKLQTGVEMGMRVLTNSIFGLGGVLDPASEMRLVKRPEDLGQTLGAWGVGTGAYLVLPIFGPSTVRDAVGLPFDRYATAPSLVIHESVYALTALQLASVRAELSTTKLLDDVSLDKYSFVREAYLARRLDQVYNGAPPIEVRRRSRRCSGPGGCGVGAETMNGARRRAAVNRCRHACIEDQARPTSAMMKG